MLTTLDVVGAQPTVTAILELPVLPSRSVDEAVIVWIPSTRGFDTVGPVPSEPCLLDDQAIDNPES
jgi:hypothetical protein